MTSLAKSAHAQWAKIARNPNDNFDSVSLAIAEFGSRPKAKSVGELLTVLQGIARGEALVSQAFQWSHPIAGRESKLAEIRGLQWRLVMAVAGLEIMIKSLLGKEHPGINEFRELNSRISVEPHPILAPCLAPSVREKWIADESLLKFLSLKGKDLKVLQDFLINDDCLSINDLAEQLALAKALRNCTAHAALSATKCNQLKIGPTLRHLPSVIHETSEGIFASLCKYLR